MEQSSSELQLRVEKQFDSFCRRVLKNEKLNYERKRRYRLEHEILFSEMTEREMSELKAVDEDMGVMEQFRVLSYNIEIKDELLGAALKHLSDKKRDVLLMSYFLDLPDREIAAEMNLVRSTITYHKSSSIQMLKKIMEDMKRGKN